MEHGAHPQLQGHPDELTVISAQQSPGVCLWSRVGTQPKMANCTGEKNVYPTLEGEVSFSVPADLDKETPGLSCCWQLSCNQEGIL